MRGEGNIASLGGWKSPAANDKSQKHGDPQCSKFCDEYFGRTWGRQSFWANRATRDHINCFRNAHKENLRNAASLADIQKQDSREGESHQNYGTSPTL